MTFGKILFTSTIFLVAFAWYVYIPLPNDIGGRQRHLLEVVETVYRVLSYPEEVFAYLNWDKAYVVYVRGVMAFLAKVLGSRTPPGVQHTDTLFDGVSVRVYVPEMRTSPGAIIYFHGGGYIMMDVESFDPLTRELARKSELVVISVDYRRAPEHVYPSALIDCEKVTQFVLKGGASPWNVDPSKVILMGDSVGGTLATVVSRRVRRKKELPKIKAQILVYPFLQLHNLFLPSYFQGGLVKTMLVRRDRIARWALLSFGLKNIGQLLPVVMSNQHLTGDIKAMSDPYVNLTLLPPKSMQDLQGVDLTTPTFPDSLVVKVKRSLKPFLTDPEALPLIQPDLSSLPLTYLLTAGFDIFRDESYLYAERLKQAGVEVIVKHYPEGFHTFLNLYQNFEIARRALDDVAEFVQEILKD